jgi:deoxyribonuclease-1-like protein
MRKSNNYRYCLWLSCVLWVALVGCDVAEDLKQAASDQLHGANSAEKTASTTGQGSAVPGAQSPGLQNSGNAVPAGTTVAHNNQAGMQAGGAGQQMPTITIASYNIQVFGTTKVGNAWVLERLAKVIRQFDVIAIQEVRATDQTVMDRFMQAVNSDGSQYNYILGPRLGRTDSKEQYAFVYNTRKIMCKKETAYTVDDPSGLLHRPPLVAHFQVLAPNNLPPFTFTLINIHTDPDEIKTELNVLGDVYRNVRQYEFPEDDVILLGDLNCGPKDFRALGQIPGIFPLIQNVPTNTRQSKLYDNIVVDQYSSQEFTGQSRVWDLKEYFQLTVDDALRLSDHFPIWAEFSAFEVNPQTPAMATNPNGVAR